MAVSEIIQFVSILREMASRKSELDKNYFETFIQPLWNLFCAVHKDYITSIKSYSDKIYNAEYPIEKLLEDISNDSIYTQDLRTELRSMSNNTPFTGYAAKRDEIQEFLDSIKKYFDLESGLYVALGKEPETLEISYDPQISENQLMNYIRIPLIIYLSSNMKEIWEQKSSPSYTITQNDNGTIETVQSGSGLSNYGDRAKAKKVFDDMGKDLQIRYKKVSDSYYSLRKNILR